VRDEHAPRTREKRPEERVASLSRSTRTRDSAEDARPVPREALLAPSLSADSELSAAYRELDTRKKPGGRLERADFVSAMGETRRVFATRQTAEVRFLDAYTRAGAAFADGDDATAWQLLRQALDTAAHLSRTLGFVRGMVDSLGPRPGPDGAWVMGLAFADVRGDLADELAKASDRAPDSPRVLYGRALAAHAAGKGEARGLAREACDGGLREACGGF
jgi:hypothetical protein